MEDTWRRHKPEERREGKEGGRTGRSLVTGVQTCALPICCDAHLALERAGSQTDVAPRQRALLRLMPQAPVPGAPRYDWLLSVTDFISGMTDSYALKQFQRLRGLQ